MNARSYKVNLTHSPVDFPPIMGLGMSSFPYQSEPHLHKDNVVLTITKKYVVTDINTNTNHEVLAVTSDYEIPARLLKSREDVYAFYLDAALSLKEAYQFTRTLEPAFPNISFPSQPIESYQAEIDRVFSVLNSQN